MQRKELHYNLGLRSANMKHSCTTGGLKTIAILNANDGTGPNILPFRSWQGQDWDQNKWKMVGSGLKQEGIIETWKYIGILNMQNQESYQ